MVDRMAAERQFAGKVFAAIRTWLAAVRDAVHRAWLELSGKFDTHAVAVTQPLWDGLVGDLQGELEAVAHAEFDSVAGIPDARQLTLIQGVLAESRVYLARVPLEVQNDLQRLISSSVAVGRTPDQIERAVDAFLDATGSENWQGRAKTIAATEVHRMANAATQAAAMYLSNTRQVAYDKSWRTRHDDRVRATHVAADGQTVPLNSKFLVGDSLMLYPGDPEAPASEVVSCRCSMIIKERSVT